MPSFWGDSPAIYPRGASRKRWYLPAGPGYYTVLEARCAHYLKGGVEVEMVVLYARSNQTLEVEQGCMAFVAVVELALDAEFLEQQAHRRYRACIHSDAVLPVAAVELMVVGGQTPSSCQSRYPSE